MTYTLQQFAQDIGSVLSDANAARTDILPYVKAALTDEAFKRTHLTPRAESDNPREVLYEDEALKFCICAHVYNGSAMGEPHDHGSSWAIYGQAEGETEMTDWRIVQQGDADNPTLVEAQNTYTLRPGDAHYYEVGAVHSPHRSHALRSCGACS